LTFTNSDYLFINEKTDENQIATKDLKLSSIYVIKTGVSKIDLENEIFNRISNDTDLSNWIIKEEQVRLSNDTDLSNWIIKEEGIRLSNDTDLNDKCCVLSSNIDNKILIDGLSVVNFELKHISQEDYYDLVKSEETLSNTLYLISSDEINAYNEKIINLAEGKISSDAVNLGQVSNLINEEKDRAINVENSILSNLNSFKTELDELKTELQNDTKLSSLLTNDINYGSLTIEDTSKVLIKLLNTLLK
jgi:translation initiation factor 6 (eIF-6)